MLIGAMSVRSQSFTGRVLDESKKSIVGATVIAFDSLYNDIVVTDVNGEFKMIDCPSIVTLRVSYMVMVCGSKRSLLILWRKGRLRLLLTSWQ